MKSCHQLVVCSEWAKNIVEDELGTTPKVIPLGVDRSLFNENNNVRRKPTIFFNCGKWEIRKGHDIIKTCFEKAFSQKDDVELWMMCENPFLGEKNSDWINYYKSSPVANKIRFIPRQKYHRDVYNIMRQVDVGVFPVRAEGWNLELLELLSCGKHVITTDYSGHTEFTNRNNSYIVETDKLVSAQDGIWFHGQGEWAELGKRQEDQIINHMRETHRLKQDSELELNLAGIETAIKFSWENTAREILNGI
jgi:glycosyltransferase involved in cell wall biosynthesis